MAEIKIDLRDFKKFTRELKTIYGPSKVNTWLRQSFGRPVPDPLKRALKSVTPRRTGRLKKTVSHQVRRRLNKLRRGRYAAGDPALFVGGRKKKGGFVYYFLRGTKDRYTKKGAYRGRIKNYRLDKKAFAIGGNETVRLFRQKFEKVFGLAVTKLKGKVGRVKIQ